MAGRYLSVGLGLLTIGSALSAFSYSILLSAPLTALGIACAILGVTAASLPEQVVPRATVRAMLRGATLSIEALLEEFEPRGSAIYLPPRDGLITASIPLSSSPEPIGSDALMDAPKRLFCNVKGEPVLTVFPPGGEVIRTMEMSSGNVLEESLRNMLVETTEICTSVRSTTVGDAVILDMEGVKIGTEAPRYRAMLGAIPSSLAACVITAVTGRPVKLVHEELNGDRIQARFGLE